MVEKIGLVVRMTLSHSMVWNPGMVSVLVKTET